MNTITRYARIALVSASLAAVPFVAACSGGAATNEPQPATASAAVSYAPVAPQSHGAVKLVGAALGEVGLRPDQRTQLEQLATDAETRHAPILTARRELHTALTAQIQAGAIDRTALQPKIDALTAAMDGARAGDRAALEKVHGILDTDQRAKFIDALHDQMKSQWKGHHGGAPLKDLAADLNLSDAQKDQIRTIMHEQWQNGGHKAMGDHRERAEKFATAFKSDHFVMEEVMPAADMKTGINDMSVKMIGLAEKVLPILTPEQRAIAAQKLQEHHEQFEQPAPQLP